MSVTHAVSGTPSNIWDRSFAPNLGGVVVVGGVVGGGGVVLFTSRPWSIHFPVLGKTPLGSQTP